MIPFDVRITKRTRRRKLAGGRVVEQTRWFANFRDPDTGQRKLPSFDTRREAEAFRSELLSKVHAGVYVDPSRAPTVGEAVGHYLSNREPEVNATVTLGHYTQAVRGGEDAMAHLDRAYGATAQTGEAAHG